MIEGPAPLQWKDNGIELWNEMEQINGMAPLIQFIEFIIAVI